MAAKKGETVFSLRIPDEVKNGMKRLAEEDERSLNTMIVMALKKFIKENTDDTTD